jgi:hypothetical protein
MILSLSLTPTIDLGRLTSLSPTTRYEYMLMPKGYHVPVNKPRGRTYEPTSPRFNGPQILFGFVMPEHDFLIGSEHNCGPMPSDTQC